MDEISVAVPPLDTPYTYRVPSALREEVKIGSRVLVPLGRRTTFGFVVPHVTRESADPDLKAFNIKEINDSVSPCHCFDRRQLALFEWMSRFYAEPLSSIIDLAVPKPVAGKRETVVSRRGTDDLSSLKLTNAQATLLTYLTEHGSTTLPTLKKLSPTWASSARALAKRNLCDITTKVILPCDGIFPSEVIYTPALPCLTDEQESISVSLKAAVEQHTFASHLIHGVTGSGKTEVYAHLIAHAVEKGYGALVLVPEIALTPQLVERIEQRLGGPIAVLHSGLPARDRWAAWEALLKGRIRVALGARSTLFAPIPNLGLIIIDEEHDGSFKQNEGIRYNARDIAVARAKLESCPIVLGSATPSLESYLKATTGTYGFSSIARRHSLSRPATVDIVDMSKIHPRELPAPSISPLLRDRIAETLARGTQAFVLYNRRGFATYLQCSHCEDVLQCPQCSVTLTYHQGRNTVLCHYCGHAGVPPVTCHKCKVTNPDGLFIQRGAGTEKIHEELQSLFPDAAIARLDRDIASDLPSYRRILDDVKSGATQILVGTQMIAKGHDLPLVTFVGVADCDVGLHMPDFRAGERVFQLLTQAAGRAGRRELESSVLLQTRSPRHPSVVFATRADSVGFIQNELLTRKALNYPPYSRLLRIVVSSTEQTNAEQTIREVANMLRSTRVMESACIELLGPVAAPLARLRNEWRYHLICKCNSISPLLTVLSIGKKATRGLRGVRVIFDLDPQEMM